MTSRTLSILITVVLVGSAPALAEGEPEVSDPWAPVRALEGRWEGEGQGFGLTSRVTHDWRFVVGGKFLRLETRSVVEGEDGDGEVHEDVGYVSSGGDDSVLRFRQFLSEGYVNTFRIEPASAPERGLIFEPESSEGAGGMLARMTLTFSEDDTYEMVLELGREGKPFKACQTMRMSKAR